MIGKLRKAWVIPTVTVALVFMGAGVPAAHGDTCCRETMQVTKSCNSKGCSGTITITECNTSVLGNGSNFQTQQVGCCGVTYPTLYSPSGVCYYSGHVQRADAQPTVVRMASVWVRSCGGRYVLLRMPVAV